MNSRSSEQKLIDIVFECVLLRHDPEYRSRFDSMSQEEMAQWVARQLAGCGFETKPCGMSWGVLQNN